MSRELALQFLRRAEHDPELRARLDAIDPRQTARLLDSLVAIARDSGLAVSTKDLKLALGDWAAEMLDDSELARIAGGLAAADERLVER